MHLQPSRAVLAALAAVYTLSLLLYAGIWIYSNQTQLQPDVELGFDNDYQPAEHAELIRRIQQNSPAQKAGLRPGDRIVALDGEPLASDRFLNSVWLQHKPGDQIHLAVERPGAAGPLFLTGTFRRSASATASDFLGRQLNAWFPVPFLVVGLAVLFLRLDDPTAWLLGLAYGGVAVSRSLPPFPSQPAWWPAAMTYQAILLAMVGPLFYWFYATFPARSPVDRRCPWLKWCLTALGVLFAWGGIRIGGIRLPPPLERRLGANISGRAGVLFVIVCLSLGLVSFAATYFTTRDSEARRRIRVMFWGTMVSLAPNVVRLFLQNTAGLPFPTWLDDLFEILLFLFPLSLAYAVVVHRVLEIPVLLRRSARYLLVQRGFTLLLSLASFGLTLAFAFSLHRILLPFLGTSQTSGIALGAAFGTALLWGGTQVHKRISGRIDRAFFRGAYDARVILEDLAEKTRTATDRSGLVRLLEFHLVEALKPRFLSVQLQSEPASTKERPEYVVPIPGRDGRQLGVLILGMRLSEEPYSGDDRRLLASVASQAGAALDNMHMAEEIAARIESERRSAREMEIARDVQSRLLPQSPPRLVTLECAARCIQARAVGGDYYDFLDLGSPLTGLVLADVSGKGVHAALLVANLQAYLRSQCSISPLQPVAMLDRLNRMLYQSTAPQHFATMFFAIYDDRARTLVYVNCGHNPPICLRRDGAISRLEATATVIGAFDRWQGSAGSMQLDPGDLLVVFSDGVSEAACGDQEFGEHRLIQELLARREASPDAIVSGVLERVQEFSEGAQSDDLTLLVARAR